MRNTVLRLTVLASLITLAPATQAAPTPRHITLNTLSPNARQLFTDSMRLADASFDPATQLLHRPGDSHEGGLYMVRESSWYALGLLLRDHADDRKTAATILDAVLQQQYTSLAPQDDPKWYGTFKRSPEEPTPAHGTPWSEYDPNWRVFIGTIFQIILIEYPDRIPAPLSERLYQSIDTALLGELHEHRLTPSYSNIALMYGALWDFAAQHNPARHPDWQSRSAQWNESVYQLFQLHDAFNEYNSPTYYGVDLYGLALLRDYASTPRLRTLASRMESALWTDIADFYSPTLRNISGPYDRSYGMDMESYVAVTGVWIRTLLPATQAPLPTSLTLSTDHVADLWFAPQLVILGNNIPTAALHKLQHPSTPRLIHHIIDDQRTATAWISPTLIFGGESTTHTRTSGPPTQFHPATIQWRTPTSPNQTPDTGKIGWIRLYQSPPIDATATSEGLDITTTGDVTFLIHAPGLNPSQLNEKLTSKTWTLPNLPITLTTDATTFKAEPTTPPQPDTYTLTYTHLTHLHLTIPTREPRNTIPKL